ncbi:MAG TPA: sulfatase-like hydrolase/transferase, partial [Opitutus sp.]|nr:sulfatase-like hydrolase/transferase [Opitutus sp.]
MKSLCLVSVLLVFFVPSAWAANGSGGAKKPNVLFLVADDLNCDLGVYGATFARTPNLDALAARSVRFERAYSQFPHCSPSRASFLTGRRPNVTGVHVNPSPQHPMGPHFRDKIPATLTLPQLFKQHGWFSARVGKLFHYGVPLDIGTSSLDDFYSWDLAINPRGRDRENLDEVFSLIPGRFGGVLSWLKDEKGSGADQTDGIGADQAIKLLEHFQREERPFFLAVGFY